MFYSMVYGFARFLCFFVYRLKITGRDNIPGGAALICANHTSNTDPVLIAFALGVNETPVFLAKAELFVNALLKKFFYAMGAIPVHRGKSDVNAVKGCLNALKSGKKLIIFPEGTRNTGEKAIEAHTGAGMFALRTGAPVLPVYITAKKRFMGRVDVVIGKPFYISGDKKAGHAAYQEESTRIMAEIAKLGSIKCV